MVGFSVIGLCDALGNPFGVSLMFQVATHAQISPLRLSFTGTLNVVRRAIPKFQRLEPEEVPFF